MNNIELELFNPRASIKSTGVILSEEQTSFDFDRLSDCMREVYADCIETLDASYKELTLMVRNQLLN